MILIVDDDQDIRDSLTDLFGSVGMQTTAYGSTNEMLGDTPPDGPTCLRTSAYGFLTGGAAGFFGIGGGFLIVPALIAATGMPMINAIGSSLLAVGTFGAATAANYALSGLVDWPVALEFVGGGVIGGLFGMRLATRLSGQKQVLSRLFAALVMMVAFYVLYRSEIEIIRQ